MAGVRPSMAAYVRHRGGSRVRKQTTIGLACSRRDARLRGAARLTNSERGFCWTLCFLSSCQLYPSLAKPIPAWLAAPKARLLKNLYFLVVCQKSLLLLARCRLDGGEVPGLNAQLLALIFLATLYQRCPGFLCELSAVLCSKHVPHNFSYPPLFASNTPLIIPRPSRHLHLTFK